LDNKPLTYRDAGVDIDAGNSLVDQIKPAVKRTSRPEVMGNIGGFGGLFALDTSRYKQPVLVSGTDGVGTKLRLAIDLQQHDTIGIDLVAMCVNDILVTGAEPLFFLDYYATGKLDTNVASSVINGIANGCEQAGCALIGGETAEMPGMYQPGDYDLAGFAVGVVEKNQIIDGSQVAVGDQLIAVASGGPHANGYSLIRKVIERSQTDFSSPEGQKLAQSLLAPTRIYVKSVDALKNQVQIKAISHITGGGITENLPRVLPENTQAEIYLASWKRPAVFDWIAEHGHIEDREMLRTFNNGVGLIIVVSADQADAAINALNQAGEQAWCIGSILESQGDAQVVYL